MRRADNKNNDTSNTPNTKTQNPNRILPTPPLNNQPQNPNYRGQWNSSNARGVNPGAPNRPVQNIVRSNSQIPRKSSSANNNSHINNNYKRLSKTEPKIIVSQDNRNVENSPKKIRVLVLGATGEGKSSFCNFITNTTKFEEGQLSSTCTQSIQSENINQNVEKDGQQFEITLFDTPGLGEEDPLKDSKNYKDIVIKLNEGIDFVVVCFSAKFRLSDTFSKIGKFYLSLLDNYLNTHRLIFVCTKIDGINLPKNTTWKEFKEHKTSDFRKKFEAAEIIPKDLKIAFKYICSRKHVEGQENLPIYSYSEKVREKIIDFFMISKPLKSKIFFPLLESFDCKRKILENSSIEKLKFIYKYLESYSKKLLLLQQHIDSASIMVDDLKQKISITTDNLNELHTPILVDSYSKSEKVGFLDHVLSVKSNKKHSIEYPKKICHNFVTESYNCKALYECETVYVKKHQVIQYLNAGKIVNVLIKPNSPTNYIYSKWSYSYCIENDPSQEFAERVKVLEEKLRDTKILLIEKTRTLDDAINVSNQYCKSQGIKLIEMKELQNDINLFKRSQFDINDLFTVYAKIEEYIISTKEINQHNTDLQNDNLNTDSDDQNSDESMQSVDNYLIITAEDNITFEEINLVDNNYFSGEKYVKYSSYSNYNISRKTPVYQCAPLFIDDIDYENFLIENSFSSDLNEIIRTLQSGAFFERFYKNRYTKVNLYLNKDGKTISLGDNPRPRDQTTIKLASIGEIRIGRKTLNFESDSSDYGYAFSLICEESLNSFDFVTENLMDYTKIIHSLIRIISDIRYEDSHKMKIRDSWDKLKFPKLNHYLLTKLFKRFQISPQNSKIIIELSGLKKNDDKTISFSTFYNIVQSLQSEDVISLFSKYSTPNFISAESFQQFLKFEQHEDKSVDEVKNLISEFSSTNSLDFDNFLTYLSSNYNNASSPPRDDMDQNLWEYFIDSSHNTYCSGNQIYGISSYDMYRRILKSGCRCIESKQFSVDTWDSETGEPIIYHGNTLTSKISTRKVCKVIKKYAFVTSPYPVILSIENRCSDSQIPALALIFREEFGDSLLLPEENFQISSITPANLKYKIIIKAKPIGDMNSITFMKSLSWTNYGDIIRSCQPWNVCSFSETDIDNITRQEFLNLNTKMFTRVYPHGLKVDSSNYSPITPWSRGCHMVALNKQNRDIHCLKNDERFRANDNCGYVLKSKYFRNPSTIDTSMLLLKIQVICLRNLPLSSVYKNVKTTLEISCDGSDSQLTTSGEVTGRRLLTQVNFVATFQLHRSLLDQTYLTISIINDSIVLPTAILIARSVVLLGYLKEGYRSLPLFDRRFSRLHGSDLFFHSEILAC